MRSVDDEKIGASSSAGSKLRIANALLTSRQRTKLLLLTVARTTVGFGDLGLAAAMYLLFVLLQGQAPAHRYAWMPKTILVASALAAVLVVVRALADVLSARAGVRQIQDLANDFMLRLTKGYCEMQWNRFVELNRGELLNVSVHTTREAADFYHRCVEMTASVVIVGVMTAALFYQSAAAAAGFTIAVAAFYGVHRLIIRKRVQAAAAAREKSLGKLQRDLSGLFSSGKEIRTYGNQDYFLGRIRGEAEEFAAGNRSAIFLPQIARIIADQGTVLLFLGLIVGAQLLQGNTHELLALLAFYFVLSRRLLPLVSQLSLIAGQMESSFENVRVVDAELNCCRLFRAATLSAVKPASGIALQLENVSFAFNGGAPIIRDVSMLLRQGEIAVLHGASGAGKTSLLNIVSGVLQPTSGSVRVDRAEISYVPQEIALLDDTVRNNLLFGLPRMDDRNLMKALAVAQLDDFVASLPRGLDTGVGDNGALFSGGERQRFGLARAILRGCRLILLDEATSALDEKNEREVLRNLAASGVAILFVTHRRHAHQWAHRLYRLENGRLIEVASATRAIDEFAVAALGRA